MIIPQEPSDLLGPFLDKLDGVRERNDYWQALCPGHDDHEPSLSIKMYPDGIGLKCHAGCTSRAILDALGLDYSAIRLPTATLSPNGHRSKPAAAPVIRETRTGDTTDHYDYQDGEGEPLFRVKRTAAKRFIQQRYNPETGTYTNGLDGLQPVLYRLPEIMRAGPSEPVFVVEGEKDADRLARAGLVATTAPMGAGKWKPEYAKYLAGRTVYVLPDNDDVGEAHAQQVAASVPGARIVRLPGLPPKGDVSDWLDAGNTIEQLLELAHSTPEDDRQPVAEPEAVEYVTNPVGYELTDLGNADRFVRQAEGRVRYIAPWADWLYFDGRRWVPKAELRAMRIAHATARATHTEAATETDLDRQRALTKFALASQNDARIKAMLSGARAYLEIKADDLDADPYALNTPSGTVDLRTGETHEHRREDHITKLTGAGYDPDATAPTFAAFLTRILPSEPVRRFVQKVIGYAASGATTEEVLPILYGHGANGKTTLINAVMEALGDYAMQAAPDLLMAKKGSHPTELADLFRARFVASTEVDEGRRFDEALVKSITGRDVIKARRMRQDFWQFAPTHTVFLSTNHRPEVRGTDLGIWRRLRPIPFEVTIPEAEQDHALPEKLRAELPGILRWIVEGCLLWQREGLAAPAEIMQAAEDYREDMDVLAPFIDEWCVVHKNAEAKATPLYNAYKDWCIQAGERIETQKRFGTRLSERGFSREKVGGSYRWYGIGISTLGPGPSNQDHHGPASGPLNGDGPANESPIPKPDTSPENRKQDHQDQESPLSGLQNPRVGVNTKHGPNGPDGPDGQIEPVENDLDQDRAEGRVRWSE